MLHCDLNKNVNFLPGVAVSSFFNQQMNFGKSFWNGRGNAWRHEEHWSRKGNRLKLQCKKVKLMSAVGKYSAVLPVPAFPVGVDTHWETQNRSVWNEKEHVSEKCELVYETSWIAELGAWRRFLRSRRRVQN